MCPQTVRDKRQSSLGCHPSKAPADSLVLLNDACTISAVFFYFERLSLIDGVAIGVHEDVDCFGDASSRSFVDLLPCSLYNGVHVCWVASHLTRFSSISSVPAPAHIREWLPHLLSYCSSQVFSTVVATGFVDLDFLLDFTFCFCKVRLGKSLVCVPRIWLSLLSG